MRSSDCPCREAADPSIKMGENLTFLQVEHASSPTPFLCAENETYEVKGPKLSGLHRWQRGCEND